MQKITFGAFKQSLLDIRNKDNACVQALLANRFKAWQIVCNYDYISEDIRTLHCSLWRVCKQVGLKQDELIMVLYGLIELGYAKKVTKLIYKL